MEPQSGKHCRNLVDHFRQLKTSMNGHSSGVRAVKVLIRPWSPRRPTDPQLRACDSCCVVHRISG